MATVGFVATAAVGARARVARVGARGAGGVGRARAARRGGGAMRAMVPLPGGATARDAALTAAAVGAAAVWLGGWQRLTARGAVASRTTRKVVHASCGPAFAALWPLYGQGGGARALAAAVPLLFAAALAASAAAARGSRRGALARAVSRRGDAAEALRGPLVYCAALLALTAALFQTPAAAVAVCNLCVGDALAEVVGRALPSPRWPATHKTVAGTAAFVAGASAASVALLGWFSRFALADAPGPPTVAAVALISALSAAAELLADRMRVDDNAAVALTAAVLSLLLLPAPAPPA